MAPASRRRLAAGSRGRRRKAGRGRTVAAREAPEVPGAPPGWPCTVCGAFAARRPRPGAADCGRRVHCDHHARQKCLEHARLHCRRPRPGRGRYLREAVDLVEARGSCRGGSLRCPPHCARAAPRSADVARLHYDRRGLSPRGRRHCADRAVRHAARRGCGRDLHDHGLPIAVCRGRRRCGMVMANVAVRRPIALVAARRSGDWPRPGRRIAE